MFAIGATVRLINEYARYGFGVVKAVHHYGHPSMPSDWTQPAYTLHLAEEDECTGEFRLRGTRYHPVILYMVPEFDMTTA